MIVGVPKESFPGERRVAVVPSVLAMLKKNGVEVTVQSGAGSAAGYADSEYTEAGAQIAKNRAEVFAAGEVILQVRGLGENPEAGKADLELLRAGKMVIGFMDPLGSPQAARQLAETGATVFSMELMPRLSRAQSMDALSAMGTIMGYKAVLIAAEALPKMFPMLMTAAGTVKPARVLVIGAGVAGLQAIATAGRLGAQIEAYDIRPAVKEQIESLGAKFVELPLEAGEAETKGGYAKEMGEEFLRRQRELLKDVMRTCDVVITTALVPGKKAPILVTGDMVETMRPGSVIVDLAAEKGGNCELTHPGERYVEHGIMIIGAVNLPSSIPYHASQMYARTAATYLNHLVKDGQIKIDLEDEITRETLVAQGGLVVHPRVKELLG